LDSDGVDEMKILYVTTRQWNPGDEFILRGVRNILGACGVVEDVANIYNKSPQTTSLFEGWNFWKKPYYKSLASSLDFALNITHYDNSFKRTHDLSFYDMVVFAGSPAWYGGRLEHLYRKLRNYQGKIFFLGIGTPNKPLALTYEERQVLERSVVSCRNEDLASDLRQLGIKADYLPCPALLSAPFERAPPTRMGIVGLGFNTPHTHRYQRISEEKFSLQCELFEYMIENYEARIVAHYVDEIDHIARAYGKEKACFVYDAAEYPGVYSQFDFVISSRVHGCGVANSVGVPNAAITHDARGSTVKGFLSESVGSLNELKDILIDYESRLIYQHERLVGHKRKTLDAYQLLLEPALSGIR